MSEPVDDKKKLADAAATCEQAIRNAITESGMAPVGYALVMVKAREDGRMSVLMSNLMPSSVLDVLRFGAENIQENMQKADDSYAGAKYVTTSGCVVDLNGDSKRKADA